MIVSINKVPTRSLYRFLCTHASLSVGEFLEVELLSQRYTHLKFLIGFAEFPFQLALPSYSVAKKLECA